LTTDDTKRCLLIYEAEVVKLKGATTRKKRDKLQHYQAVPISKTILDFHPNDILSMDYFYVQGVPFHHSISNGYRYRNTILLRGKQKVNKKKRKKNVRKSNAKNVTNMSKKTINKDLTRGIHITQVNRDNKCKVLE